MLSIIHVPLRGMGFLHPFHESGQWKDDFFIANYRLLDGGLEARQSSCMIKNAMLPISPYRGSLFCIAIVAIAIRSEVLNMDNLEMDLPFHRNASPLRPNSTGSTHSHVEA